MKTMTVQLAVNTVIETDPFGTPIEETTFVDVPGCLVGQPSTDEIAQTMEMYGKQLAYVIGVPKGDTHNWIDTDVIMFGERFKTIGHPMTGIQENIPLDWGMNVKVERYGWASI